MPGVFRCILSRFSYGFGPSPRQPPLYFVEASLQGVQNYKKDIGGEKGDDCEVEVEAVLRQDQSIRNI